jgi:DNA polymerase III alpha subunit
MPHNPPEVNKGIIELADAANVKIVVTPDCHHSDTSQKEVQELMLLLNTHAKLQKDVTYDKLKNMNLLWIALTISMALIV